MYYHPRATRICSYVILICFMILIMHMHMMLCCCGLIEFRIASQSVHYWLLTVCSA